MEEIKNLLTEKKLSDLKEVLLNYNSIDICDLLQELEIEDALIIFRLLVKDEAADVFARLDSDRQEELINSFSDRELSEIVAQLFADDAADLVEEMPSAVVKRILANTNASKRKYINELLKYPEDSAGSMMTVEYITLKVNMSVEEAFERIRKTGANKETIYTLYVLDSSRHLVGVCTVKELLLSEKDVRIKDLMETQIISVETDTDQEEVAKLFAKYDFLALPVVDKENRMVGIITIDDALDVISEEHEEDFELMGGVKPSEDTYFKMSVWQHTRNRVVWLLILMLSAMVTGTIITSYEEAFAHLPILVAFIPMLMDTGGNCGAQSSTMVIRGLATDEIELKDLLKVWFKELRIALLVGLILCIVNGLRIYLQYQDLMLAITISLTLIMTVIIAKSLGCLLPMLAKKLGVDPAIMASPMLTTIVDACSILIFFNIAVAIMHI